MKVNAAMDVPIFKLYVPRMATEKMIAKIATHLISNFSYGRLAKSLRHDWQGGQLFSNTTHSTTMMNVMPNTMAMATKGQMYDFVAMSDI
jgi:hypothetical protein